MKKIFLDVPQKKEGSRESYLTDPDKWYIKSKPDHPNALSADALGVPLLDTSDICNCQITALGKVDNPECPECFPK